MLKSYKRLLNYFKKPVKLYWWRYQYPDSMNFGDEVTPYIIKKLFGYRISWSAPNECDIAGAGSIIEILQRDSNGKHIIIWGSGFIREGAAGLDKNLQPIAVRGKSTRNRINKHVVIGDPGILMSLAHPINNPRATHKVGILPHYIDADLPIIQNLKNCLPDCKVINALDSPEKVAEEIASCEIVLSSSLHGLIFSDSYGVPNCRLVLSDKITGGDYKYDDYASSIDRTIQTLNTDDLERLLNDKTFVDSLIQSYEYSSLISVVQNNLCNAFLAQY